MKYFSMMAAAVAMTAMTMVSCDGKGGANLKDGVDTLAYNLGVAQTEGLKLMLCLTWNHAWRILLNYSIF